MPCEEYNPGLDRYFREAESYKRKIPPDEETALFARIRGAGGGDAARARNSLMEANLDLGIVLAHTMSGRGVPLDELVSEANVALLDAVEKYDSKRKPGNFRSYAAGVIANALRLRCWEGDRLIAVPAKTARSMFRIYEAREKLTKELKRPPTDEELSAETKLSLRIIRHRKHVPFGAGSLDAVIPGTGAASNSPTDDEYMTGTPGGRIPAPREDDHRPFYCSASQITDRDALVILRWALRRLEKNQYLVLKYNFNLYRRNRRTGNPLPQLSTAAVCRLLKYTRSLLCRVHYASLRELRDIMLAKFLKEFGVAPAARRTLEKVVLRERLAEQAGRI